MSFRFLVIGAGFSGAVVANRLASTLDCSIDVWEERDHIGGNCHTHRDAETGVMVHTYGPHIFNTDRKDLWDYVNSLTEFRPYVHRVKAMSKGKLYSLPVNLATINQLFNKNFTPEEAKAFLATLADTSIDEPKNFEEQALRFIGRELYYAFFYGYTKKQWGCEPVELPASILKRIPIRFNYDDSYHDKKYSGIPVNGYTEIFEKLLALPNIHVHLGKKFNSSMDLGGYDHIFYTGPLDAWFGYRFGRLGYRTVTFEKFTEQGDHQHAAQVNYCDEEIPYTRIVEHKHFAPWESHESTVYFKEYSTETGETDIPYYPKRLKADKELLGRYREAALGSKNVSFLGRLATYRYMDMHHVIREALDHAELFRKAVTSHQPAPVFPNPEM